MEHQGSQRCVGGGHTHCVSFHDISSLANLYSAWREFRCGKTKKTDVQAFELQLESNLFALHHEMIVGTYIPRPYETFFVKDPKLRCIHKACVRDRVVHQALFRVLYPVVDQKLSSSVYSARKNFGTHKGVKKLYQALSKKTKNWKRETWVLKIDIRKFFDSVDHTILKQKIGVYGFDADIISMLEILVNSFHKTNKKGLPLGNVTSQLFANIYLSDFDWFVKNELGIKDYFRYCDDMVFILKNKNEKDVLLKKIQEYLSKQLFLELHPGKIHLPKVRQGIDFLGYVILPQAVVLRTNTKKRIYKNVSKNKNSAVLDSYLGVSTYAKSRKLTQYLLREKALGSR